MNKEYYLQKKGKIKNLDVELEIDDGENGKRKIRCTYIDVLNAIKYTNDTNILIHECFNGIQIFSSQISKDILQPSYNDHFTFNNLIK